MAKLRGFAKFCVFFMVFGVFWQLLFMAAGNHMPQQVAIAAPFHELPYTPEPTPFVTAPVPLETPVAMVEPYGGKYTGARFDGPIPPALGDTVIVTKTFARCYTEQGAITLMKLSQSHNDQEISSFMEEYGHYQMIEENTRAELISISGEHNNLACISLNSGTCMFFPSFFLRRMV